MRLKAAFVGMSIVMAVGVLMGCQAGSPQEASLEVACDEFSASGVVSEQAALSVGQTLTVTLCSNPTTGFMWSQEAQISDSAVISQTGHEFVSPQHKDTPIVGASGVEVWTFRALKAGTADVSMEYSRPWEGGEKGEWSFNLAITVD